MPSAAPTEQDQDLAFEVLYNHLKDSAVRLSAVLPSPLDSVMREFDRIGRELVALVSWEEFGGLWFEALLCAQAQAQGEVGA